MPICHYLFISIQFTQYLDDLLCYCTAKRKIVSTKYNPTNCTNIPRIAE